MQICYHSYTIRQMYFGEKGTYEDMKMTRKPDVLSEKATRYEEDLHEKLAGNVICLTYTKRRNPR